MNKWWIDAMHICQCLCSLITDWNWLVTVRGVCTARKSLPWTYIVGDDIKVTVIFYKSDEGNNVRLMRSNKNDINDKHWSNVFAHTIKCFTFHIHLTFYFKLNFPLMIILNTLMFNLTNLTLHHYLIILNFCKCSCSFSVVTSRCYCWKYTFNK